MLVTLLSTPFPERPVAVTSNQGIESGSGEIDPSGRFTCDFTPIFVLPRGTGVMSANHRSLLLMKLCFRRLKGPAELLLRALLTDVDL